MHSAYFALAQQQRQQHSLPFSWVLCSATAFNLPSAPYNIQIQGPILIPLYISLRRLGIVKAIHDSKLSTFIQGLPLIHTSLAHNVNSHLSVALEGEMEKCWKAAKLLYMT